MSDQDRAAIWDANNLADQLFGHGGGVAIWVRRDEGAARCAMRGAADLVQTVMDLAAAQAGFQRLVETIAEAEGVTVADLMGMIAHTRHLTDPLTEHVARIKGKA